MAKDEETKLFNFVIFITVGVLILGLALISMIEICVPTQNTPQSIIDSTVIITNGGGHGSGVYLGNGIILTAWHCLGIEGAVIFDSQGHMYQIKEEIVCGDWSEDIGFIKINPKAKIPAMKRFGNMPKIGDGAFICGTPMDIGLINTITYGIISNINISYSIWSNAIVSDAISLPGNSGGGIYNEDYELIGILVGGPSTLSVCEPIEDIIRMMELEL